MVILQAFALQRRGMILLVCGAGVLLHADHHLAYIVEMCLLQP